MRAAIAAARTPPGQIATLILPADTAWNEGSGPARCRRRRSPRRVSPEAVAEAARVLRSGEPTLILLTGRALREDGLELAGKIAAKTGARLIAQGSNARTQRGRGRVSVERVPYVVDQALKVLAGLKHIILVGAKMPVAFFAYPDKPSLLTPPDAVGHVLARPDEDLIGALEALAEEVGARATPAPVRERRRRAGHGRDHFGDARRLARRAVAGERDRRRRGGDDRARLLRADQPAAPHDWLSNMGGSIGLGPPLATGAAVACPDRKVVCLQADGSAMYTVQALWTQAREGLDVTTVLFSNRTYQILQAANWPMSGPAIRAARRSTCSISASPTSTGWGSRARRARREGHRHGRVQPPLCRGGRHAGAVPGRGRALSMRVTPAKAGVQDLWRRRWRPSDSRFRGNDEKIGWMIACAVLMAR